MVITRQTTKVMDSSTSQLEREAENNNNTVLCDRCKCVVTVKFEEMKSTMDDIKEILSRTQTYQDSCEDSLFVLNEQFNELKQNRESEQREMSQRMRAIENDIKRLTASLSEMSTVNTNSIVRSYSDVVRAPSVSRGPLPGTRPRVSVAHPSPKPNTILVMGDSNTRYVNLGGARVSQVRVPTYTIEDIDPYKCAGYETVWLHVGINSLKWYNCGDLAGVRQKFDLFMYKVHQIGEISPNTKLIVSPILPTAIKKLNARARYFNSLLFSVRAWWRNLGFNDFLDGRGLLADTYRSFRNKTDCIHLGYIGINRLTSKVKSAMADTRGSIPITPPASTRRTL